MNYQGWECARVESGGVEALVTLDVGPRVIRLGPVGGPNLLYESEKDRGLRGGDTYRSYGGHRLWVAPEDPQRTYTPDNERVEVADSWFCSAPNRFGLRKAIRVSPSEEGFVVEHRVGNEGSTPHNLALWCLTVMAPGGECAFRQEPHVPHGESLLPARPLVLWAYTEMDDPRWTWGRRTVRLRHDPARGPQKAGALLGDGLAVYSLAGRSFVKRFPTVVGAPYPDMGCNFEVFTRHEMLEVESLGPLVDLQPGESAFHTEHWAVVEGTAPAGDEACAEWLEDLASRLPQPE